MPKLLLKTEQPKPVIEEVKKPVVKVVKKQEEPF